MKDLEIYYMHKKYHLKKKCQIYIEIWFFL